MFDRERAPRWPSLLILALCLLAWLLGYGRTPAPPPPPPPMQEEAPELREMRRRQVEQGRRVAPEVGIRRSAREA